MNRPSYTHKYPHTPEGLVGECVFVFVIFFLCCNLYAAPVLPTYTLRQGNVSVSLLWSFNMTGNLSQIYLKCATSTPVVPLLCCDATVDLITVHHVLCLRMRRRKAKATGLQRFNFLMTYRMVYRELCMHIYAHKNISTCVLYSL